MSASAKKYLYGENTLLLDERKSISSDGLDKVSQEWVSDRENLFKLKAKMRGYSNIYIDRIECSDDAGDFRYSVSGSGIINGSLKRESGYPKLEYNLEGFDSAQDSFISSRRNEVSVGDSLDDHPNMVCISVGVEPINERCSSFSPRYVGVLNGNGDKPYKRTISVNEQIVKPKNPIVVNLPGGWLQSANGSISMPTIVVTDYQVIIGGPDTTLIPGNVTPPNPPSILPLDFSHSSIEQNFVKHWPNGWKLASIDGEYIPGTNIWIGSLTYEYVWPETF